MPAKIFAKKKFLRYNIFVIYFSLFMNTLHLNESFPESEKLIASTTVNSNQDLANWLKAEHISPASITRFSVSFLAKIPENTSVQLLEKDGKMLIKVGESSLKIADTIES